MHLACNPVSLGFAHNIGVVASERLGMAQFRAQ